MGDALVMPFATHTPTPTRFHTKNKHKKTEYIHHAPAELFPAFLFISMIWVLIITVGGLLHVFIPQRLDEL